MGSALKGRVALVTGAGSQIGFGKAIALILAGEGCHIVAADIDLKGAKQTAAQVEALGCQAMAVKADITSSTEVTDMVKTALKIFGQIDILVNNAGATNPPKVFAESTEKEWDFDINLNLKGMLICTKAVLGHMLSRRSGKIVNISSGAGIIGIPFATTYSAAKAGVIVFTKALAAEVAPSGINVNSVAPGMAMTGFQKNTPPEFVEAVKKQVPVGRLTTPQDIANAVLFLASDASSDIIGQTITVSGQVNG